jgi:pimeloyl-ACP methyl ester carboxylesterase
LSHAERLSNAFPDSRIRVVEGSSTYVMLDDPGQTAAALAEFSAE